MTAIPALIVAPAIVAAGIAYRYSGSGSSSSDDARRGTTVRARGIRGRRSDTMSSGFEDATEQQDGGSGTRSGTGQPQKQHMNEYIPTTMLGPGLSRFDPQGVNSLAAQTGEPKAPSKYRGEKDPFEHYHPAVITTKQYSKPLIGPYARTDEEHQQKSWLGRTMDKVTGDLGPIEHQDEMRRTINPARDSDQFSSTDVSYHMKGSVYSPESLPGADGTLPRPMLRRSTKQTKDAPVHKASRAADDVTSKGVDDVDANRAATDVTRQDETARGSGIWSEGDRSDVDPTQSESARQKSRAWFWSKKQDADQAASSAAESVKRGVNEAADTAKQAAESSRGWFWSKKQDADQAAAGASDTVKRGANEAADAAKQAADNTRHWFWNKKEEASQAAANAADTAKQAANETRDWASRKTQEVSNAAADAKNTASAAVEGTEDWLRAKKDSAESAASNAADSARDSAAGARDWVYDKSSELGRDVASAGDQSRAWMWSQKSKADQALADAAGSVKTSAGDASARAQEAASSARQSADRRTSSSQQQQTIPEDSRPSSLMTSASAKGDSIMHALDERVDEARAALRATSQDLRSMAERARPQPTNEGLVPVGGIAGNPAEGAQVKLRLVESNSGIPVLSSGDTTAK